MLKGLLRAHRFRAVALAIAVLGLAVVATALAVAVGLALMGRPALLDGILEALRACDRLLEVGCVLLGATLLFEQRGARIRAILRRRARLGRAV